MTKERNDKGKAIFGLNKIPDHIIIREQNVELGKLKSSVDELEFKLNKANNKIKENNNSTDEKLLKRVNNLQDLINGLENKADNLNKQINAKEKSLANKNKIIEEMQDRFRILNRKYDIIQKELLEKLKKELKQ